mgnify:FL=1
MKIKINKRCKTHQIFQVVDDGIGGDLADFVWKNVNYYYRKDLDYWNETQVWSLFWDRRARNKIHSISWDEIQIKK